MAEDDCLVVCADIGSVPNRKFAWAASTGETEESTDDLAARVAEALASGKRVALGFECPGWVPVPTISADLGRGRAGEGGHPWSGGPGAAVLATGLAQISWILRAVNQPPLGVSATTVRSAWGEDKPLLLWEAFVAGDRKPVESAGGHKADAAAGVEAFLRGATLAPTPGEHNSTSEATEGSPLNVLALLASWARLNIDEDEQRQYFPIYAPSRPEKGQ